MVSQTVYAEFSDFNSAELAARHIKNNFDSVSRIQVGRLSYDPSGLDPRRFELHEPEDFARAGLSGRNMSEFVFSAFNSSTSVFLNDAGLKESELDYADDSFIKVTAASDTCRKISAYCTNAGGLKVKIL